jgi:hypothetical protein
MQIWLKTLYYLKKICKKTLIFNNRVKIKILKKYNLDLKTINNKTLFKKFK